MFRYSGQRRERLRFRVSDHVYVRSLNVGYTTMSRRRRCRCHWSRFSVGLSLAAGGGGAQCVDCMDEVDKNQFFESNVCKQKNLFGN